jgi:hypothetical protein
MIGSFSAFRGLGGSARWLGLLERSTRAAHGPEPPQIIPQPVHLGRQLIEAIPVCHRQLSVVVQVTFLGNERVDAPEDVLVGAGLIRGRHVIAQPMVDV